MKIKQILTKDCIIAELQSQSKDLVLRELASAVTLAKPSLGPQFTEGLIHVLAEREKLGSTGIGNGVAIPHGKMAGIDQVITGFGRSRAGVNFDSQDGKPAHLFFILVAPENAASLHLKALARLSRLLKDSHFRNVLMEAQTADEIYSAIVTEDDKF